MNEDEKFQRAVLLQMIDYLSKDEMFVECNICNGTGDGHTWIPICQTCYGLGKLVNFK